MVGAGYRLDETERAQLIGLRQQPGFQVLLNIMECEVSKFSEVWLNLPAEEDAKILASHKVAKGAAQFYQGVVNTINTEMNIYYQREKQGEILPDITAELFSE